MPVGIDIQSDVMEPRTSARYVVARHSKPHQKLYKVVGCVVLANLPLSICRFDSRDSQDTETSA